ncbi:MAG: type II toxin-antitoxin system VapC family toxin [Desulfobacterales bacterium]|nr:type II toxin-antitoxin system VapC family toxin [Desulfobacterales bacterium]
MRYVDTSVLVAYYCPEPLSKQVQSLLRDETSPALSVLTEVELFSAVARKVRAGEIGKADGNRILAKFSSHVDANLYKMIPVEKHHWRLSRGWLGLFATPLRTLDALHLAIASAEGCEIVTADKALYRAADDLGVPARLVGE